MKEKIINPFISYYENNIPVYSFNDIKALLSKQKSKKEETLELIIQQSHRNRCLIFGCHFGIEHVDKKPLDNCMFCGMPRPDLTGYWSEKLPDKK